MKKFLLSIAAGLMILLAVAPSSSAQNNGDPADNCGPGPNGYTWYQEDCAYPLGGDTGGGDMAGETDGGGTDGYVPGDGGVVDPVNPAPNCGPGPNGYSWYQADCAFPLGGDPAPAPNCGPGPNGFMWYQEDCPNPTNPEPATYVCGPGDKGYFWEQDTPCAPEFSGNGAIVVLSAEGEQIGSASADADVITVDAAATDRQVILADAETGEVLGVSTVAAGSVVAAAKAPVAAAGAAALPNTGAESMNMAQLALGLVAVGGMLMLVSRRREATELVG